jgi:hypothetical protein
MSKRDDNPDKPASVATQDETGEPFLKRWSRLKSEEGSEAAEPATDAITEDGALTETHTDTLGEEEVPAIDPADLPDVETLGKDSDYTVFMQAGVPDALRTNALRKLFASNPGLAVLDGLNEYDEDYSKLGIVSQVVKTAYKAGRGFLEDEDLVEIDEVEEIDETEEIGDGEDGDEPVADLEDPTIAEEGETVAANDRGDKTES